jgi:hypothetical protein
MGNEVKGIAAVARPVVLAVAAMAGVLAFLASMTATFLGGFTRVPTTPPDDVLYVLYFSNLIILAPWVAFLLTRTWRRLHINDRSEKWTRFFKCLTFMIVGASLGMYLKCLLRLGERRFDHELPGAGVLCLFGALCCLEYLRDYRIAAPWRDETSHTRTRLVCLGISVTAIAITAALVGYLLAIGKIR